MPLVPWSNGPTLKVSPSTSVSFASTSTSTAMFSLVCAESSVATGASFTGLTVIATVVGGVEASSASFATYVNESAPLKFAFGTYENEPSAFSVRVPCNGPVTRLAVSESPSTSVSFPSTPGAATESVWSSSTE